MKDLGLHKIFYLCLLSVALRGQTPAFEKDMAMMTAQFVNAPKISYQLKYVLRRTHDAGSEVISQLNGRFVKNGPVFLSAYDQLFSLNLPDQVIYVDGAEKYIRIKKQKVVANPAPNVLEELKSYLPLLEKVSSGSDPKTNTVTYHLVFKKELNARLQAYEICLQQKTHYIERLTLFYNEGALEADEGWAIKGDERPRLDIFFSAYNDVKNYKAEELQPDYYYERKDKRLVTMNGFKTYQIKELY